jgi:hypothetical protein
VITPAGYLPMQTWCALTMSSPLPASGAILAGYRDAAILPGAAAGNGGPNENGPAKVRFGNRDDGGLAWLGAVGHVAIFRAQLTQSQVADLVVAAHADGLLQGVAVADDFNRPDGAIGSAWHTNAGSGTIAGGAVRCDSNNFVLLHQTPMTSSDQYAQASHVSGSPVEPSVIVRAESITSTTYYMGRFSDVGGSRYEIHSRVNGVFTQLASFAQSAPPAPFTVRLEVQGSTLRLYGNGDLKVTVEDTAITTGNTVGLRCNSVGSSMDNFAAGTI